MKEHSAIQDLNDAVQGRMDLVARATVPIYGDDSGKPVPCGSGVLVRVGDLRFVVTAAHVADVASEMPLFTGSEAGLVKFRGLRSRTTGEEGRSRLQDQLDVGVLTFELGEQLPIQDDDFVHLPDVDATTDAKDDEFFLVAGYPGTKRKTLRFSETLEAGLYSALAVSRSRADYDVLNLSQDNHLLLGFSKKRMWKQGVRVHAPDLHEMSGCGVWAVQDSNGRVLEQPRLSALLIGPRQPRNVPVLQATRMRVAVAGIVRTIDGLQRFASG